MGKVMLTILGMVAEMELGFSRERQLAGIAKAKAGKAAIGVSHG
jgi:DNA invertase Pin-like site-specific DNA recombinase